MTKYYRVSKHEFLKLDEASAHMYDFSTGVSWVTGLPDARVSSIVSHCEEVNKEVFDHYSNKMGLALK